VSNPLVSVVIPTYQRHEQLAQLLKSIAESNYPPDAIEIIIVDNASDLELKDLPSAATNAKIIKPGRNTWSNGARRIGTENAHGEYVFHIDDDNVLDPECIAMLISTLEAEPELGMVGPLMLDADTGKILSAGAQITKFGLIRYVLGGQPVADTELPRSMSGFDYLHNAILIRRSVLERVSFDDANFPHNWAESDFGLRAAATGVAMACVTGARESHYAGYTSHLTRVGPDKTYDQAKSRILFRRRHMNRVSDWARFWLIVFPASTAVYLVAIMRCGKERVRTLSSYFRGTRDGFRRSVAEAPEPRLAQLKVASR
jgi:GT2 family glycosyltransferase